VAKRQERKTEKRVTVSGEKSGGRQPRKGRNESVCKRPEKKEKMFESLLSRKKKRGTEIWEKVQIVRQLKGRGGKGKKNLRSAEKGQEYSQKRGRRKGAPKASTEKKELVPTCGFLLR